MWNRKGGSIMTKNIQPQVFLLHLEQRHVIYLIEFLRMFSLVFKSSSHSHYCWIVLTIINLMINEVINKLKSDHRKIA